MGQNAGRSGLIDAPPKDELLVRPEIRQNEWWNSYVARTLDANGVRTSQVGVNPVCEQLVAEMVGRNVAESHAAGASIDEMRRRFGRFQLPRWAVRGTTSGVARCMTCLEEGENTIAMSWRLRRIGCCERHRTQLQAACPACRKGILLRDISMGRCTCGFDLSLQRESPTASEQEIQLQLKLAAKIDWGVVSTLSLSTEERLEETIALYAFSMELLLTLGRKKDRARNGITTGAHQVVQALQLSPAPKIGWLEELWPSLRTMSDLNQAMSFVARLNHEEKVAKTAMSRLPLLRWMQQLVDLGASTASAEQHGWIAEGEWKSKLVFLTRAAKIVGLEKDRLIGLVERGELEPSRRLDGERRAMLFDLDELTRLSPDQKNIRPRTRSRKLGLSKNGLGYLRSSGMVTVRIDKCGLQRIDMREVKHLLHELSKVSKPLQGEPRNLVTLASDTIWQRRHLPVVREFFERLRLGDPPLWCHGTASGFERYFVDPLPLADLARRRRLAARAVDQDENQLELGLSSGSPTYGWMGVAYKTRSPTKNPRGRRVTPGQLSLLGTQ